MQKTLMLVLAGVAIGLLVAPEKGSVTQRKVSNWLNGRSGDARDMMDDAADSVQSTAHSVKNDLQNAGDNLQDEFRDTARSIS
ncbi:MAG TPA: YtxH domain-containing protein [Chitinophagaceae bacterium]|jgi:gas vesicle protein|nr:YtxH domain-containing protein [Chitinophagaceae bacterium]